MNLQKIFQIYNYLYSGGGSYDQEENQKKIGKWVELFEGFHKYAQVIVVEDHMIKKGFQKYAQVIYNGEYNMNNMKVGRWDIMYDRDQDGKYKQMQILMNLQEIFNIYKYIYSGGGSYDQEGNQQKIGKWVELDESFGYGVEYIYNGEYNKKGEKKGIWLEMDIRQNKKRGEEKYCNGKIKK